MGLDECRAAASTTSQALLSVLSTRAPSRLGPVWDRQEGNTPQLPIGDISSFSRGSKWSPHPSSAFSYMRRDSRELSS